MKRKTLILTTLVISAGIWLAVGCSANQPQALSIDYSGAKLGGIDSAKAYPPIQLVEVPKYSDEGPILWVEPPEFDCRALSQPNWIDETNPAETSMARSSEGYRIQIYSGRDKAFAKRVEGDALNRAGLEVYLNYEAPQYKVRAGNYVERSQAVADCERLKQMGFSEAWVVRTTITVQ